MLPWPMHIHTRRHYNEGELYDSNFRHERPYLKVYYEIFDIHESLKFVNNSVQWVAFLGEMPEQSVWLSRNTVYKSAYVNT